MNIEGKQVIVSLSGGKDSVAMWLWAIRQGLNPVAVYVDTKWEWDGHYKYMALLESKIGPFNRVSADLSFADITLKKRKSFPSRVRKWCTEELKLIPFKAWLDHFRDECGKDCVVLLGIRRSESTKRQHAEEWEWSDFYDCQVWRPILDWNVQRVVAEIRLAGIPMHPLYQLGAERVGCFPCVNASKRELRLVAELAPERVTEIREIEQKIGATMFVRDRRAERKRTGGNGPAVVPIGIDEVMTWAKTKRGGHELELVKPPSGCARWGVCEFTEQEADDQIFYEEFIR